MSVLIRLIEMVSKIATPILVASERVLQRFIPSSPFLENLPSDPFPSSVTHWQGFVLPSGDLHRISKSCRSFRWSLLQVLWSHWKHFASSPTLVSIGVLILC